MRLEQFPQRADCDGAPALEEAIEAVLDATGWRWSRRAASWAVAVTERLPREVTIVTAEDRVRVETTLAEWDEIPPICREALAEFLLAAQAGLRFAHCELDDRQARLVSPVAADRLDEDLPQALLGVAAGCELLAREAAVLLRPHVAEIYLQRRRISGETPA
jgi:hypothetical protein